MPLRRAPLRGLLLSLLLLAPVIARAEDAPSPEDLLGRSRASREEQVEVVTRLLLRDDGRSRAWGAYLAAEHGVREAIPRLIDLVAGSGDWYGPTPRPALLAVYDALLRLDARVEARPLLTTVTRGSTLFGPAAVALLVRGDDAAGRLEAYDALDALERSHEESWLALGNTLAKARAAGFSARVLARLVLHLEIEVLHDEGGMFGGGRGSFGLRCGDGSLEIPPAYPPLFLYSLTLRPAPGDVVLAVGRRTVYLHRRPMSKGFGSTSRSSPPRDEDRLGWLADLLGAEPGDLPVKVRSAATVRWTGPDAYRVEVERARKEILSNWWALARRLVDAGHLTDADARALRPRLETDVEDTRPEKTPPLPDLPEPDLACPWPAPGK